MNELKFNDLSTRQSEEHAKGNCKEEIQLHTDLDMWMYVCKPCGKTRLMTIGEQKKEKLI